MRSSALSLLSLVFFSIPSPGETVLPIEIEFGSAFVDAHVNGRDVRLGIDTGGAGFLRLERDLVESLGLETSLSKEVNTNAFGVQKDVLDLILPALKIGGTQFTDIPAFTESEDARVEGDPPAWWPKSDGTIGREFLKQFLVLIDYQAKRITLYDHSESHAAPCVGASIPLVEHAEGVYASDVQTIDGEFAAIWDTGASHSFVKESAAKNRRLPLDVDENGATLYRTKEVAFEGFEAGPTAFVVLPLVEPEGIDLFIGANFFESHSVCLNARDGWVRVMPN